MSPLPVAQAGRRGESAAFGVRSIKPGFADPKEKDMAVPYQVVPGAVSTRR
jgi:hypothetical protein